MFKFVKMRYGDITLPTARKVKLTFGSDTTIAKGDAIAVVYTEAGTSPYALSGALAKLTNATAGRAIFIAAEGKSFTASTAAEILVYDIYEDMVFEVEADEDLSSAQVGVEYLLSADGQLTDTPTGTGSHNTYRGVILYDNSVATAAGKPALVTFPRA